MSCTDFKALLVELEINVLLFYLVEGLLDQLFGEDPLTLAGFEGSGTREIYFIYTQFVVVFVVTYSKLLAF